MKDRLSIEQSDKLIELGVDSGKAHLYAIDNRGEERAIFSLEDMFSMIPKWIKHRCYLLSLEIGIDRYSDKWYAQYVNDNYIDEAGTYCAEEELIDAVYELLVCCLSKNTIKING